MKLEDMEKVRKLNHERETIKEALSLLKRDQIPFKVTGKPGDRTALRLEVTTISSAAGATPAIATIEGEVVIVGKDGVLPGDVDGDGQLTARDAMDALKMSVGNMDVNLATDVDSDGRVTARDATVILQKVVGK